MRTVGSGLTETRRRGTPSERLNRWLSRGVWTVGGVLAALAMIGGGEFGFSSVGQFVGTSIVWGMITGAFSLPMLLAARLFSAPVARRLDVLHTRQLLSGLRDRGLPAPTPSKGIVGLWRRWRRRARRNRWLRRAATVWVGFVPAIATILLALSSADGVRIVGSALESAMVFGFVVWVGGAMGLWGSRRSPVIDGAELSALLDESGVPESARRGVAIEIEPEAIRVRAATAAPVSVEPVTASTIKQSRHSEPTGDRAFDEATRVTVDDRAHAPLQAWMTAEVRAALAALVADGGRVLTGAVQGEYDLTDEDDVRAFVAGVAAAARSADALNRRAVFGARDRVLDAASRAQAPSEVQALVDGIRRHVPPAEVGRTAGWWATGVRGPARTFALDLALDRGQRIALALQIDDDETEYSGVRGAALGDALEQRSSHAMTRLYQALHAGDAWRVVEAAAGCDRPLDQDEARDVAGAALGSSLSAPIRAAVVARIAPSLAPAALDALAEEVVATRCGPLTAESRAADILATQTSSVVLAKAGRALQSRIAATRQGALAVVQPEGVAGGLAVAQPAAAWREGASAVAAGASVAAVEVGGADSTHEIESEDVVTVRV